MPRKAAQPPPQATTPAQAIAPGGLLAHDFQGPSWDRWRAILKGAYAEAMTAEEIALFREVADRNPPTRRVRELWVVAGRRAGKDSIASAIATVAALDDYSAFLRTGERATVMCLATDRTQAQIVHRYVAGYFETLPALKPLVLRQTDDTLELRNGVEILIATNNPRAPRGRTVAVAIFDEAAYWRSDDTVAPDSEVFAAIEPATLTIPSALLIGISSPYRRRGLLFEKWRKHYGRNDDDVLVVRGPSRTFNPTLPQRIIDARLEEDPEAGAAEYLAEWRSDVDDFLDRALVESAMDAGVVVRPRIQNVSYLAFGDVSGGRGSSFALAVAHADGDAVVLDALYERRAPFNPADALREAAALARGYGVHTVSGDRYGADWVASAWEAEGISYATSEQDKSAIYAAALPLFTSGRARLLDVQRLAHQFASLERRVSRFGRDRVGPQSGAADDLANAAAGALVLAATEAKPALIRAVQLLHDGAGVPLPRWCENVDAVVWIDADGVAATTFWARCSHAVPPLTLLDFTVAQVGPGAVPGAFKEANRYAEQCRMAYDGRLYVPAVLAEQYADLRVNAVPVGWLRDINALRLAVGTQTAAGTVKLSTIAAEKARGTAFAGSLEGWMKQPDALAMSFMLGVVLSLGLAEPGG